MNKNRGMISLLINLVLRHKISSKQMMKIKVQLKTNFRVLVKETKLILPKQTLELKKENVTVKLMNIQILNYQSIKNLLIYLLKNEFICKCNII